MCWNPLNYTDYASKDSKTNLRNHWNHLNSKELTDAKYSKNPSNIYDESTFCEPCYYKIFGEKCSKCLQPVPPYCFSVRHEDKIYHKECFLCVRCKKTLANKQVYRVGNVLICKSCF